MKRFCLSKRGMLTVLACVAFLIVLMGGIDAAESCTYNVVGSCYPAVCDDPITYECYLDFETIQSAVGSYPIIVCPGTYIENVEIGYDTFTRYSEGIVVAADPNKHVFHGGNDIIQSLTIKGAIGWCQGYPGEDDDYCAGISDVESQIHYNIITDNYYGVKSVESYGYYNSISSNSIIYNTIGVKLANNSSNSIYYNYISDNTIGVELENTSDDEMYDNSITDNTIGVKLTNVTSPDIFDNLITNNYYGLELVDTSGVIIYHNNIIGNTIQAEDNNAANNDWHNPTLLEGNYWSDYTGLDDGSSGRTAGDGIGDTDIPHHNDNYPFMFSDGWSCSNSPVRIAGTTPVYYSTLQDAYNAATNGDIIQSRAGLFTVGLDINRSISVTLEGGYDCDYSTVSGNTRIKCDMTVSNGALTIGNLILEI